MKDDFKFPKAVFHESMAPVELHRANAGQFEAAASKVMEKHADAFKQLEESDRSYFVEKGKDPFDPRNHVYVTSPPPLEGTKYDDGKPDLSLVSSELMTALARVRGWAISSGKYERDNWKKGFKFNRSIAAALRHIMSFKDGEDLDAESGETHIAHAIACLEHLLHDYKYRKGQNDDRS